VILSRKPRLLRVLGLVAALLCLPPLAMGAWAIGLQLVGNVHVVEPGELYRSAQLNGASLDGVLKRHGIKTVINLRGENAASPWYRDEMAAVQADGVSHIDVRMSATHEPDPATLAKLIEALRTGPKPILIHCQSGSDRTGLASAIYEVLVAGRPAAEASKQLSFFYGHFPYAPWPFNNTPPMDTTFSRVSWPT
jgi:protein tyrosine/serine phosphatase